MSQNTNRAKLKLANNNQEYRIIWFNFEYPPYWDECVGYHYKRTRKSVVGSKSYRCWKRKEIMHHEYRMYRTWKHNRKNQWK